MAGGFYSKAADTCQESCGGRALANAWMNKNGIAKVQPPIFDRLTSSSNHAERARFVSLD